jgi:hypothetical protein
MLNLLGDDAIILRRVEQIYIKNSSGFPSQHPQGDLYTSTQPPAMFSIDVKDYTTSSCLPDAGSRVLMLQRAGGWKTLAKKNSHFCESRALHH